MSPPADDFIDRFAIRTAKTPLATLGELGAAFARLPYENLTKLIKGEPRWPQEVLDEHEALGTGGTCFSLTELFGEVLARLDIDSRPVLCDTPHQAKGHCGLLVGVDGDTFLIDPAYLIHEPIRIDGKRHDLHTYGRYRYTVDTAHVSRREFLRVWNDSFTWTGMGNLHICAPTDNGYQYVHGSHLRTQTQTDKHNESLKGSEPEAFERRFGIRAEVTQRALQVLADARDLRRSE